MLRKTLAMLAALMLLVLVGCGGGPETPATSGGGAAPATPAATPVAKKATAGAAAYDKAKSTGSIKGTITLDGKAPGRPQINTGAEAKCAAMHTEPMLSETVVSKDGKLQNVIVYIKSGYDKFTYEPNTDAVTIDQKGCQYLPHVLALMVGQPLLVKNSDELAHNIHGTSQVQPFNEGQAHAGMEKKITFKEPEMGMRIQCDIHKWMGASAGVFEHPFYAVTDENGAFEIKNVPAGEYELAVWHESSDNKDKDENKLEGPAAVKVTVADKEVTQDFKYKVKE